MPVSFEDASKLVEITEPIWAPMIQSILAPKIASFTEWLKVHRTNQKLYESSIYEKFDRYLKNLYENSSYLTTLVFPNNLTKITDLYVPLTLISTKNSKSFKITEFDPSILENNPKILISDYAGMGKSTLSKWITRQLIEQQISIPILIELRKIDTKHTVISEVFSQIDPIDKEFDRDIAFKLLELGCFTVILDGFDEIPTDSQESVIHDIREFVKKTPNNRFIMTSRPETALSSFADFQSFYIQPLQQQEAYDLIFKLDKLSRVKYGEKLIAEIEAKSPQVNEFLTNPFLTSLLYKAYTYNKDIPSKKSTFYEEVYCCLFKNHDLSKEGFKRPKKSRLDILDFDIILRSIGFDTAKIGKVIYDRDELLNHIIDSKKKNAGVEFKEQNYLEDLTTTVPVFVNEGTKIKWAHKSLQDYFAAKYISNHVRKVEILERILLTEKFYYLNILDLLHELEPKIFRKLITQKILREYISFRQEFQFSPDLPEIEIAIRASFCFSTKTCLIKVDNEIGFTSAQKLYVEATNSDINLPVRMCYHSSEKLYIASNPSLQNELIRLLKNKNEDLFSEYPFPEFSPLTCSPFDNGKAYVLDGDTDATYNLPDNFSQINQFLLSIDSHYQNGSNACILDLQKCKKYLSKIEQEIQTDESEDLLADI